MDEIKENSEKEPRVDAWRTTRDTLFPRTPPAGPIQKRRTGLTVTEWRQALRDRDRAPAELAVYRQLAEATDQGIWICGFNLKITFLNDGLGRLLQNARLIGQSLRKIYPPEIMRRVETEILPIVLQSGRWKGELGVQGPAGTVPTIENFTLVRDIQGKPLCIANFVTDISRYKELERAEREARAAAESAGQARMLFLANMSHEMRTPLNSILGFTEILREELDGSPHARYARWITINGESLLGLINDILDLSRIEAGAMELEEKPLNPARLLRECHGIFQVRAENARLDFPLTLEGDFPPALLLDELRLRQILNNLLGNAFKFTEHGAVNLTAGVRPAGNERYDLWIEVSDSGPGIPPEEQERVFESFRQKSGQSQARYGGTGLGLAISRQLARLMGGSLELESTVGAGSRFRLRLPDVAVAPPAANGPADANLDHLRFLPAKILLVDDFDFNRKLVTQFLRFQPIEITEATDGLAALDLYETTRPTLILLDIRMPRMDGREFTIEFRKRYPAAATPILVLTASSLREEEDEILKLCDGILRKPFRKKELFQALSRLLPHRVI